jgi:origin recognition complex subunit 1
MSAHTPSNGEAQSSGYRRRPIPGVSREDSDDELGSDDLPWEWIYDVQSPKRTDADDSSGDRKRRKLTKGTIIGAHIGDFECRVGDCVLLKAEGSNEAWVGLICEFVQDDDGEGDMAANFMWFSTESEIRNKNKKRDDHYWVMTIPAIGIA